MPSARLRKLEVEANNAFDQYRDLYVSPTLRGLSVCLSVSHGVGVQWWGGSAGLCDARQIEFVSWCQRQMLRCFPTFLPLEQIDAVSVLA